MKLDFKDQVVFVTGSSQGIGFHIANQFLELGANVVFNARNDSARIPKSDRVLFIKADLSDEAECSKAIIQIKNWKNRLDILVPNIGSGHSVKPGDEDLSEWTKMLKINLLATTTIIEKSIQLIELTKGNIICISSACGKEYFDGAPLAYSVAKSALNSYVRSYAQIIGKKSVRINAVAPGNILWDGNLWDRSIKNTPEIAEKVLNKTALKRFGDANDVAYATCFLASKYSSFTTGSIFYVDGGFTSSFN